MCVVFYIYSVYLVYSVYVCSVRVFSHMTTLFVCLCQRCIALRLNMKTCLSSKSSSSSLSTSTRLQFTSLSSKAGENSWNQSEQASQLQPIRTRLLFFPYSYVPFSFFLVVCFFTLSRLFLSIFRMFVWGVETGRLWFRSYNVYQAHCVGLVC